MLADSASDLYLQQRIHAIAFHVTIDTKVGPAARKTRFLSLDARIIQHVYLSQAIVSKSRTSVVPFRIMFQYCELQDLLQPSTRSMVVNTRRRSPDQPPATFERGTHSWPVSRRLVRSSCQVLSLHVRADNGIGDRVRHGVVQHHANFACKHDGCSQRYDEQTNLESRPYLCNNKKCWQPEITTYKRSFCLICILQFSRAHATSARAALR